jgi:uncharacterized protein YoxC
MAETHENPWPEESHAGTPAPGSNPSDLPVDFLDDAPETTAETPGVPEIEAAAPALAAAGPVVYEPAATSPSAVDMGEDRKAPLFPMLLGTLMLAALIVAVFVSTKPGDASAAPGPGVATTTPAAPAAPATAPPPSAADVLAGDVKKVEGEVAGLVTQLKDLQAKVASLSQPAPAPDLKPITTKLDGIEKSFAATSALPDKLTKLDQRIGGLDGALKTVGDKVAGLSDAVKKAGADAAAAKDAAAKAASPPAADPGAAVLAEGSSLFKASNYTQAVDAFKKAVDAGSKDARIYYYAALSHGMSTNDWAGETDTLARRGSELEKAGTPKAADIDSAFNALPANLKKWLDFYRGAAR